MSLTFLCSNFSNVFRINNCLKIITHDLKIFIQIKAIIVYLKLIFLFYRLCKTTL
jgi:hypothetical protein